MIFLYNVQIWVSLEKQKVILSDFGLEDNLVIKFKEVTVMSKNFIKYF